MSSYVEKVLQPGETVAFKGTIHLLIYLSAILFATLAAAGVLAQAIWGTPDSSGPAAVFAGGALIVSLLSFIRAWFRRFTTEIAVTDRRVIFKHGFIRRQTTEMNMSKVESVEVDQSILGRIFDFGDILVRGTGVGLEPLTMIAHPLAFRNAVIAR